MQQMQNLASEDETAMNCLQVCEQGFMRDIWTKVFTKKVKLNTKQTTVNSISAPPTVPPPPPNNQSYLTTKVETRIK